jgi:hypothetical protein
MQKLILNSQNTAQILVDYINASNQVTSYALSINTTQLPALVVSPANYGDFVQTFSKANLNVMGWLDEVVPDFNLLPNAFISYNLTFQQEVLLIQGYLLQLKDSPGDPTIIQNIKTKLEGLISVANASSATLNGLDTAISKYQSTLLPDATILKTLCDLITAAENVDADSIKLLNGVLGNLQSVVDDRNQLITLNILANITEGIFIAVIGVGLGIVFTGPVGVIVGLGFGVGSAVFTTLVPVGKDINYEETLEDIQTDMNNVNNEIGVINTTVGLLQNLNTKFTNIIAQSSVTSTNLQSVLSFWQKLENNLTQVINEMNATLGDDGANIDQAIADLTLATTAWNQIESYMQSISKVTFNIDPAVSMAPTVTKLAGVRFFQKSAK